MRSGEQWRGVACGGERSCGEGGAVEWSGSAGKGRADESLDEGGTCAGLRTG